ncbi:MAG: CRISPR-associated helicase Cas3' [Candidatus Thermoplasmatota archaeon]
MEVKQLFRKITGYEPYNFQLECSQILSNGESLILTAPTGSGKSEAVLIPFILFKNKELPPQMIYSLPTRTLIDNLSQRVQKYAAFNNTSLAIHHGQRIESPLFDEDIIITTIDQTVSAYVCAPLNAPLRRGNILAGGVSSAFLVFDEIHTFDPYRALQTTITLIHHSSKLKNPVCIISATLPSVLVEKIEKIIKQNYDRVKTKDIEDENEISSRKKREVKIHLIEKPLSPDVVMDVYSTITEKKLIVVCNTVGKAQTLFKDLKGKTDAKLILIHSRFLDKDRREKEEEIQKLLSIDNKEKVILISTQVIEVGIDISANTLLTEIAPIDSLIQRAGRCARRGGKGDLYICTTQDHGPYSEMEDIVENTKTELKQYNGETLNWELERKLVNKILTSYYTEILNDTNRYEILGKLARAVYEGDKKLAEETVRDAYTCGVSICNNPTGLGNDVVKLQKVNVNVWVFRQKVKELLEAGVNVWKIEEDYIIGDYETRYTVSLIKNEYEILPFYNYVVPVDGANYNKEVGLVLGEKGVQEFSKIEGELIEEKIRESYMKKETWVEHANKTLKIFNTHFLPRYGYVIGKFAEAFNLDKKDLIDKIRIAVALHDIGKLNICWQKKVGWDGREPLAHSDKEDITRVGIPHATVSATALSGIFSEWKKQVGIPFYLAVAHHHTPRAREYPKYKFVNSWKKILSEVLPDLSPNKIASFSNGRGEIEMTFIDISQEQNILPYKLYTFVSKVLRLSDWIATGGEGNEILCI